MVLAYLGCPVLNFFSKKVHKKLAKRYTRSARVRTPARGVEKI